MNQSLCINGATQLLIVKDIKLANQRTKGIGKGHRRSQSSNLITMLNGASIALARLGMLPPVWHMNIMAGRQDRILDEDHYSDKPAVAKDTPEFSTQQCAKCGGDFQSTGNRTMCRNCNPDGYQ